MIKALIILREIQSKSSLNFMIMRITFPNLLYSSDFSLHELFMNLRKIFPGLKVVLLFYADFKVFPPTLTHFEYCL